MQNAPENINYLSPTGYRFQCQAFPETQFYCQQAVIPGVNISEVEVATPHRPHYVAGDRLNYDAFSITMIVDEYMRNWQEIQEWIIGLGKPENYDQYRKAKVDDKIELIIGPALTTLESLLDQYLEKFDLIFIDANKKDYGSYYEFGYQLVRKHGLIIFDNVLWDGKVINPNNNEKSTVAIQRLNSKLLHDDRVSISMLPINDGITIAYKN